MRSQIVGGTVSPSALPKYQSKQARRRSQLVTMTRNSVCVRSSAGRYWRLISRTEWSFLVVPSSFFFLFQCDLNLTTLTLFIFCLSILCLFFQGPYVFPWCSTFFTCPCPCVQRTYLTSLPSVVDCYRPTCPLASKYIWSAMSMVMFWFGLSPKITRLRKDRGHGQRFW